MGLFKKNRKQTVTVAQAAIQSAERAERERFSLPSYGEVCERELYDRLRAAVPIIDAALTKIVRLTGGFCLIAEDAQLQQQLDGFSANVPVGLTGIGIQTFADSYLDSLLTYGSAVGEMLYDESGLAGLYIGDSSNVTVRYGKSPCERVYYMKNGDKTELIRYPERVLFTALGNTNGKGVSVLRGLPSLSGILMRIYECIGQNFDRIGNVRYAVTYKPSADSGERGFARERAMQIAKEWSDGMNSAKYGVVKDFVAVGDVDIKVIGAENQLYDTNIPVRQILEQLISKLSIPPFLLGLSWSSTERMSAQQADILTTELEYYRRILTPVLQRIGNAFLSENGGNGGCRVEWDFINLQDEAELALARLRNSQALEIERKIKD